MSKLEGKVAVITGGNSGIGLATAQRFVAEGAYVFITGRRQSELDATVKQLGKSVTAVQGDVSVYSASKAAVRSFARTLTTDLKDRKIRVNAISPGVIPSPGYSNSLGMTEEQIKQYADSMADKIPLGRTGTLDEVAKVVAFLASDESSYVTGIELFVDGGMTQI
jgi:NAD(P)-dependent dehydrogenase (short-subunit alcohol dehydrogenase family)